MPSNNALDDQIVHLPVGLDLFTSQVIAESVKSAGFSVELREMIPEGVALAQIQQHLLLVRAGDIDAVRELVDKSYPTSG